jgi:hypothetical protein
MTTASAPPAEFRAALPSGGAFYARWPQSIDLDSLRMVRTVLGLTLDWWIDDAARRAAGEAEYASWSVSSSAKGQA